MKNLRRITALILALFLMVVSLPTVSVFANNSTYTDMYYGKKMLSQMRNSDNLIRVYELLVDGCADLDEKIDIPNNISINRDELFTVYSMFYGDYPEYFWVGNGSPGYTMYGNKIIKVDPIYSTANIPNMVRAKAEYNEIIAELTSGLSGKSDYEKSKILHDRLCETTAYVFGNNHQSSYGALVEGEAVCNGYARAYQHLLKAVGIAAWYVKGTSYDPVSSARVAHAWNSVKLDGAWYYTDVTWDDFSYSNKDYPLYAYMNITRNQLLADHIIDSSLTSLVPSAISTAANYYVREDLIFSGYDRDRLIEALSNDEFMAQIQVTGNMTTFQSQFAADRMIIASALSSTPAKSIFIASIRDVLLIDYEIPINCQHEYENNCDEICNLCYATRDVPGHVYENGCDKTCNECGETRYVYGHTYSNNCDDSCNECGFTRTINHVYSNDCDARCNLCQSIRQVRGHVYSNACDTICNECGDPRDVPDHVYTSSCDENCNECGFVRGAQPHTYSHDCDTVCNVCESVRQVSGHIYNNGCDITCNKCGEERRTEHNYNGDHICDECGFGNVNIAEIFPDTDNSAWYSDAVAYAYSRGIIKGYQNGKFGASDGIQRQDFLVMLARFDGVDLTEYDYDCDMPDVARNSYYEAAVNWGVENRITTGYVDGTFGVGDMITREQIVTFLYRYTQNVLYMDVTPEDEDKAKAYPDYSNVSEFSTEPIIWAIDKGVINGKQGKIAPQGNAQRCEIAQIMYNIFLNDIF